MMAVCGTAVALLLVMLTGVSYSYPVKQGFDPSSSYSYDANPVSAGWEAPSSGRLVPGSGAASRTVKTAPHRGHSYPQPSSRHGPVASYSSNTFAAPERSGYASSSPGGSNPFQPTAPKEFAWAVAPPSQFSTEETSTSARRPASSRSAPEPLDHSNVSPPGHFVPELHAGELSQAEKSYEHGNYESETEEQSFQSPSPSPVPVKVLDGQDVGELHPSGPSRHSAEYPYPNPFDYMFLNGPYPRGTLTHYSSSFKLGKDHWEESRHVRDYFPAHPSVQEVEPLPAGFGTPQGFKQPNQPVQPSIDSTSYAQGGTAEGQNHPYGGVGLGHYSQSGWVEQPHQESRTGGHGWRKVGY